MRYTRTDFWPKNAIGIAASIADLFERIARAEGIAQIHHLTSLA